MLQRVFFVVVIIFLLGGQAIAETYKVKEGDSLYNIGKKFHVSVKEIKEINGLSSNRLKIGSRLVIPAKVSSEKAVDRHAISKASGIKYHKVKKGESLYTIARQYGLSVDELKEINGLKDSNLRIGQRLSLAASASHSIIVKSSGTVKPSGEDHKTIYAVKKGDSIYAIAKRYGINQKEIRRTNRLKDNRLKPGQRLVLYVKTETKKPPSERPDITLSELSHDPLLKDPAPDVDVQEHKEGTESDKQEGIEGLDKQERLALFAKKFLGIPYRFGGSTLFGIDCSAFVQKVFGFFKVPLPRTAREQFSVGEDIDKNDLSIGDLVFFRTYARFPSHVGIYIGNNLFIHASSKVRRVTIDSLDEPYYLKRFIGARRIMEDGVNDALTDGGEK